MKKDALKKHHFWVFAGLAPLLTLAAVFLVWGDVGAAVEKQRKEITTKLGEVQKIKPQGKLAAVGLEKQKGDLGAKRSELWLDNFGRQAEAGLYAWPEADGATDPRGRLKELEKSLPKFGQDFRDDAGVLEVFRQPAVYDRAYEKLGRMIYPTVFRDGNWRNVLRHVNAWGPRTSPLQLWLALEDFWVQRALLLPVRAVNEAVAEFHLVREVKGGKDVTPALKRTFVNPVWQLDLEVPAAGPEAGKVLRAKLTNRTDRMQLLGVGNTMRFKVWLGKGPAVQPIDFRVEGEFLKAREEYDVRVVPKLHGIPVGTVVAEIARVRLELDERTVPVRMVAAVRLEQLDARRAAAGKELVVPTFVKADAAPVAVPGTPGVPAPPPVAPTDVPGAAGAMGGSPTQILDDHKKRYLEANPQVRRMPVAVAVVVDQMYMDDVLVAYANSPLRFQTTQYEWRRFRGTLPPPGPPPGSAEETPAAGPAPAPAAPFAPAPPPSAFGPASTVAEEQTTSGLIELHVYGILSLYEKPDDPKPAADPAAPKQP